jgi:methionyl aminopeptidase
MVAVGTGETVQKPREWPVRTRDGSLSVHYEHDVLMGEHGPEILTVGMEDLGDVIA